jgi:cytochrome P450
MLAAQETDGSFTDDEIIGNTLAILTAGEDTTAHMMGWTIWFLASRPDIQTRLAQEADEVLGEHPFPHEHETVARLRCSEAVLRESLRLKSVAPQASSFDPERWLGDGDGDRQAPHHIVWDDVVHGGSAPHHIGAP